MDGTAKARAVLRVVGGVAIALSLLGLAYNGVTLLGVLLRPWPGPQAPYFLPVFLTMSAICIVCYVLLLISGIQFVRGDMRLVYLFAGVLLFEIVYFLSVGPLWLVPGLGMSIAAASGVADGGLMFQACVLFPLWAPLVAFWAKRRIEGSSASDARRGAMGP